MKVAGDRGGGSRKWCWNRPASCASRRSRNCSCRLAFRPTSRCRPVRAVIVGNSSALGALASAVGADGASDRRHSVDVGPATAPGFSAAVAVATRRDTVIPSSPCSSRRWQWGDRVRRRTVQRRLGHRRRPSMSTFLGDEGVLPGLSVTGPGGSGRWPGPSRATAAPRTRSGTPALAHVAHHQAWRLRPGRKLTRPGRHRKPGSGARADPRVARRERQPSRGIGVPPTVGRALSALPGSRSSRSPQSTIREGFSLGGATDRVPGRRQGQLARSGADGPSPRGRPPGSARRRRFVTAVRRRLTETDRRRRLLRSHSGWRQGA